MRQTIRLAPAEGVAPGQTATIKLPKPRTYHAFVLATNIPTSKINEVRVMANAKAIMSFSGEALDVMNEFDGLQAGDGSFVRICIDQTGLKRRDLEELTALNIGSLNPKTGQIIDSLSLEVDIDGTATTPAITNAYAIQSPVREGGPGMIRSLRRLYAQGLAGRWDFDKLPKGTRSHQWISRIFIKAANITDLEIERDGRTVWERTTALNDFMLADSERSPQAGWVVVDFSEDGYGENKLDVRTAQDLRLKLTSSGAETVEILAEYLGELEV
ncbi:major capsid protein P2 [uncultured Microbulbifer sp.]|uniref:major capsid protein P2 n=1 Tax=uncultured Microbulbifer sp. TaxID=348147 RepID=UPI0025E3AD9B|nr:major capsid protein P2 [uncultured Microbulbifer sp.]